jgi:D-threo-aldose 1-dehydrogenase
MSSLTLRTLGSTNVTVTALGFGAAQIGNLYRAVDDDTARSAVDAAWDGGIRYFDTAPHYGLGLSELRLGRALQTRPRNEYCISTKVGRVLAPNPAPQGSDMTAGGFDVPDDLCRVKDYSRDGVLRSLEGSLLRLDLDRVDVVYVHDPENDMDAAVRHAIPALIEMREQGVLRAVGAGMNYVKPLQRIVAETDVDVVMVAGRYTLADRTAEPLLDQCVARGVSIVLAAPFNSGLLARAWPPDDAYFDYKPAPPAILATARAYAQICLNNDVELPHAALQFPLQHPAITSVVTGLRSPTHVRNALSWITTPLPDQVWSDLRSLRGAKSLRSTS